MLTKLSRDELPNYRGREPTPLRLFADETLDEFIATSEVGDIAEVTGWPECGNGTQRVANYLRDRLFYRERGADWRKALRVITRNNSRVFLERVRQEPPEK